MLKFFGNDQFKKQFKFHRILGDKDSKNFLNIYYCYIFILRLRCKSWNVLVTFRRELVVGYVTWKKKQNKKTKKARKPLVLKESWQIMIDWVQNHDIVIRQNKNNPKGMQSAVRVSLFHVASSIIGKKNWHYPHCPEGRSWLHINLVLGYPYLL